MSNLPDAAQLRSLVQRVEKLDEEQRALGDDKRDVYAEAKSQGFDPKIVRRCVQARRQDRAKRVEEAELMQVYMEALGEPG